MLTVEKITTNSNQRWNSIMLISKIRSGNDPESTNTMNYFTKIEGRNESDKSRRK